MIKLCSGYGLQKIIYEECGVLIKISKIIDNDLRYFFKRCENKIKLYKVISEEDLLEKTIRLIKDKFKGEK